MIFANCLEDNVIAFLRWIYGIIRFEIKHLHTNSTLHLVAWATWQVYGIFAIADGHLCLRFVKVRLYGRISCGGNALRVEGVVVVEAATVFGIDFIKMTGMSLPRFMV